jgi:anti-sigma regulatory factor (Ser/Thr protein kinase)
MHGVQGSFHRETEIVAAFSASREAPGCARRLVVAALRGRGHADALVEDAALVVSELTTNAVLHADSSFSISVRSEHSMLRFAVQDGTPFTADAREHGLIARPTHGLGLIELLTTRWGVESTLDGKVVWAELPYARL